MIIKEVWREGEYCEEGDRPEADPGHHQEQSGKDEGNTQKRRARNHRKILGNEKGKYMFGHIFL